MDGRFLYFGYGSNMLTRRLRAANRAPSAVLHGRGHVARRKLTFHKVSADGSGKCDMPLTGNPDDCVEGVLFWIPNDEKAALRTAEGYGHGYDETVVDVVTENGIEKALAYVATNLNAALVPYVWYRSLVLAGALEHGLPASYVDAIRAVTARTDPRPDRPTKREAEAALEGTSLPSE